MFKEDENRYQRAVIREISAEASCDYVIPDYLGEVRKMLFTEARCLPLPTYMSGEEICASGAVEFRMIYTDAEGRLSSVTFSEDYECCERVSADDLPEISSESEISSFSMRLLGPRKISAKARVSTNARLHFAEGVELCGTAAELPTLERAERRISVMNDLEGEPFEREYAEAITELEGVILDDARVIHERAECRILECRAAEGEVWVSGEHIISALIALGDEPARVYEKAIPFAETLKLGGASEDMTASVSAIYPSLKIEITPNDLGSSVCASFITEYIPRASGNRPMQITTDAYLTDRECECRYSELVLGHFLERRSAEDTIDLPLDFESLSLEMPESILFITAEPRIRSTELADGTLKILSDIRFSGIACEVNGEEARSYAQLRHTAEHTKEITLADGCAGEVLPEVCVVMSDVKGRVEDGRVVLSARLNYTAKLTSKDKYRYLSEIDSIGEPEEKKKNGKISVYYPDTEDTLFDVARKFRTTAERVAIDNSLTEAAIADGCSPASLVGVDMLIIK